MMAPAERASAKDAAPAGMSAAALQLNNANGVAANTAQIQIGDMLEIAAKLSDGVAVVELTVVDIEEAGGQLEVLLTSNGLQVIPKDGESQDADRAEAVSDKRNAARKSRGAADAHHLTLMYVDAPRETIAQVLDEMVQQHLFSRATLKPPVPASSIASIEGTDGTVPEQEQLNASKNGDQVLVEQAVETGRNYAAQQVPEAKNALQEQSAGRRNTRQQGVSNSFGRRQADRQLRGIDGKEAKPGAGWLPKAAAERLAENQPADALAAVSESPQWAYRAQQNNSVVMMDLDTKTGLVANNSVIARQPATYAASQAKAKKSSAGEKSKADAETFGAKNTEREPLSEDETLPAPSVRVLFVLQRAEDAETP
jgi:hypothetical protein